MFRRGFTLIELLVVIAIIGLLSSVTLASLNSARTKAQVSAIKANLRNMVTAAELSYANANPNSYSGACTAAGPMIAGIARAGGTASCYSLDGKRWGASAHLNSDSSRNWAVDSMGVVTWDKQEVDLSGNLVEFPVDMDWDAAVSACAAAKGRLPSVEQLRALFDSHGDTPPSFEAFFYWSSTEVTAYSAAYYVDMYNGDIDNTPKFITFHVRCVR